jgi:hypothetical protein
VTNLVPRLLPRPVTNLDEGGPLPMFGPHAQHFCLFNPDRYLLGL